MKNPNIFQEFKRLGNSLNTNFLNPINMNDKVLITKEQAMNLIVEGDDVHTFKQAGRMLLGADWSREAIAKGLEESEQIELAGDNAKSMKHAVVFYDRSGPVFVETDMIKVEELETQLAQL